MRIPGNISDRAAVIRPGLLNLYVLASVPVLILGIWHMGQILPGYPYNPDSISAWEAFIFRRLTGDMGSQNGAAASLVIGVFFLSRLVVAALVSYTWASLFSRIRQKPLDPGWFHLAWWFTLLMPASVPLPFLALGLSFGLVFGCHVFGGTGRYIVNPALLGAVFLAFSWPAAISGGWLPGLDLVSSWEQLINEGHAAFITSGTCLLYTSDAADDYFWVYVSVVGV